MVAQWILDPLDRVRLSEAQYEIKKLNQYEF